MRQSIAHIAVIAAQLAVIVIAIGPGGGMKW